MYHQSVWLVLILLLSFVPCSYGNKEGSKYPSEDVDVAPSGTAHPVGPLDWPAPPPPPEDNAKWAAFNSLHASSVKKMEKKIEIKLPGLKKIKLF